MIRSILFPLVILGTAAAIVYFYTLPFYEEVQSLDREKAAYERELSQANEILELNSNLERQYNEFSDADRRKLEKMLPSSVDAIKVIAETNAIANGSGVVITSVESGSDGQSSADQAVAANYNTESTSYTVAADYNNFLEFLNKLELGLRLTDIQGIEFSADAESGLSEFTIDTNTYWLNQ